MGDQDNGQSLGDTVKNDIAGAYKKANDWFSSLGGKSAPAPASDHDKAIADMNRKATEKGVQDATKTFSTQTAAQKKTSPAPTPGKTMIKPGPRKRM